MKRGIANWFVMHLYDELCSTNRPAETFGLKQMKFLEIHFWGRGVALPGRCSKIVIFWLVQYRLCKLRAGFFFFSACATKSVFYFYLAHRWMSTELFFAFSGFKTGFSVFTILHMPSQASSVWQYISGVFPHWCSLNLDFTSCAMSHLMSDIFKLEYV